VRKQRRKLRIDEPSSTADLILDEAMRIIARRGVEDLRIKDLAESVGIQPPSVYRHFSSREAIISALATKMVADLAAFLPPASDIQPMLWMHAWVRSLVWFYSARPAYAILILREISTPSGIDAMESAIGAPEDAFTNGPLRQASADFRMVFDKGVEMGDFQPTNYSYLSSVIHGAILTALLWPYGQGRRPGNLAAHDLMRLQEDVVTIFSAVANRR
jgi:AcrR family transcriptional regulator